MTIRQEFRDEISEIDLHAYADGLLALDADRVRRIEDWLAQHPEGRCKVETYRRQRNLIRQAYGNMTSSEIPPRLRSAFGGNKPRRKRTSNTAIGIAATVLLGIPTAMTAGDLWDVASWTVNSEQARPAAMTASTVSTERERVPVAVPDFSPAGLNYVGHETLKITAERTVWRVRYVDAAGNEVELLVTPRPNERQLLPGSEFERTPLTWSRGEFVYSLHSDLPAQSQQALADLLESSQPSATAVQQPLMAPSPQGTAVNAVRTESQASSGVKNDAPSSQKPGVFTGPKKEAVPIANPIKLEGPLL